MDPLAWLTVLIAILALIFAVTPAPAAPSVRAYTKALVEERWPGQWPHAQLIVGPESGWHPCAVYPSRRDCSYAGRNSCGIPQATPCPVAWRGRLWETRYAQAQWLVRYILRRYGSPARALAFRRAHGWF